jgi:hypothetical protein
MLPNEPEEEGDLNVRKILATILAMAKQPIQD